MKLLAELPAEHGDPLCSAGTNGLTDTQRRRSLELFQSDISPVLRREIPSRPFPEASA
jgi:hypothetical protein